MSALQRILPVADARGVHAFGYRPNIPAEELRRRERPVFAKLLTKAGTARLLRLAPKWTS